MNRLRNLLVVLMILAIPHPTVFAFEEFLKRYCHECHNASLMEQELNISALSRDFQDSADAHLWGEVIERINSGEMPPSDSRQPPASEIRTTVNQLTSLLRAGRAKRMSQRPAIAHYRLSRAEYRNTVFDLLGVRYDPTKPGELNEDTRWLGYDRIGSQLTLSSSHIDRYFQAAGTVLERAFSNLEADTTKVRMNAAELHYGGGVKQAEALERFGIQRPLRLLLFPGRVQPALSPNWMGSKGSKASGLYKLRLQASGIRPRNGQTAHLSIGYQTSEETVDALIEFDIDAPEDQPAIYEFDVFLEMPAKLHFSVVATNVIDRRQGAAFRNALASGGSYLFTHSSETKLLNPNAPQMFDDQGNGIFSTVLLDWIEWEGPIVRDDERSRRVGVIPEPTVPLGEVSSHLQRFADRAWRRPVADSEISRYLQTYQEELKAGEPHREAFLTALQGILTSRNFIYLVQGDSTGRSMLDEWEVASRLSYFLWSSMPDSELITSSKDGALMTPEGRKRSVERMLLDTRITHFIEDFTSQWLQLHRVGMFPPDKKIYTRYDAWLEACLKREPIEFVRAVFSNNLSIDQFIHSDWTIANRRLCEFYALPTPNQSGYQRINLPADSHRGGLLTMGSTLGLTSDGTRHRPVHRGVWVSETFFNHTPPQPPANVDPIEPIPPEGDKITVRKRIENHAKQPSCAACHQAIDPLGLAFDHYDAVGQWRTEEIVIGGRGDNPKVDASGTLADGRVFRDPEEFKRLMLDDRDRFARAFVEHLCTYALRRVLTVDDNELVDRIVERAKQKNYQMQDIVRLVATSELIRQR